MVYNFVSKTLQSYHEGQFIYPIVSWRSQSSSPHNKPAKHPTAFKDILSANLWKINDASRIDLCQTSERMLAEQAFELTTPGLTWMQKDVSDTEK